MGVNLVKTVAKNTGLTILAFVLLSLRMYAGESEWWSAEDIAKDYQFLTMEVSGNGDVYAVIHNRLYAPESYSILRMRHGSSEFEFFWAPSPPFTPNKQAIGMVSYDSTVFLRGNFGYYRFNADGSTTDIMCVDTAYWPNWFIPINKQSVYIYGAWGLVEPIGSNNALFQVVRSVIDSGCVEEYSVVPSLRHGFISCVAADALGKPYFTFSTRDPRTESIDTLIRTRGGAGVTIKGFNQARYFDAEFIFKEDFGWVVLLQTIGASDKPGLLLKLSPDFTLLSSHVLPGKFSSIRNARSYNGRILVCQTQEYGIFDLTTETWTVKTFEDVVGRKPLTDGETVYCAGLHEQDLYVCHWSGIRVFRDVITTVSEAPIHHESGILAVFANQDGNVQTQLPDGQHDIVVYSVLGEQRTFSVTVQNGNIRLNSTCLWNGLNVVQAGQERHCVLYIP